MTTISNAAEAAAESASVDPMDMGGVGTTSIDNDTVEEEEPAAAAAAAAAAVQRQQQKQQQQEAHPATTTATSLERKLAQFRLQMQRLQALEQATAVRAAAVRRRTCALLEQDAVHRGGDTRSTHGRLFVTHAYTPEVTAAGAMAALMQKASDHTPHVALKPCRPVWTVTVEGTLLVGHMDYASAEEWDANTGYTTAAPNDDVLDRSNGGTEEEVKPAPIKFTHLFDKVTVAFQTVFGPKQNPVAAAPKKKSSRRSSAAQASLPKGSSSSSGSSNTQTSKSNSAADKKQQQQQQQQQEEKDHRVTSIKHIVQWTKEGSNTPDAHAFSFPYTEPAPPDPKHKVLCVTCHIELHRRHSYTTTNNNSSSTSSTAAVGPATKYRITSEALQTALFPHHGPVTTDILTGTKRKMGDMEQLQADSIPTNNQVHIPSILSMSDICSAFFQYILSRKLVHEQDVVQADKLLVDLLGMEQFSFSQLQQLLLSRGLVQRVGVDDPVQVTYIMERDESVNQDDNVDNGSDASMLQLDMDVAVPNYWQYRTRELLRRVKRRELEYTSSRPKARYLLGSAVEERAVRCALEQCYKNPYQTGTDSLVAVHLALAKAAPPGTQAQRQGHLDARMAYHLEELQARVPAARKAWDGVEAWLDLAKRS